ncbi:PREDICTED: nuclear pore complex protein NUP50B-like [Camelina sativa]|uniref:Nuclear pore complex protein NUP50B-like n=1 Tax=Camelina sativa TaxID=90675 RepID=A0ABM0XKU7_CAMSA|nr:PREDICTED: nuclear pore complex protein NUP50B-like [Camelina sativa]
MGDSENAQQPSKKRAALKELSRDNPGLDDDDDDDDDEDTCALASGTFKTASEEVLTTRKNFRAKRRDPSATAAAPLASNPFAGIRLVPFTAPVPSTTAEETNKPLSGLDSTPSEGKQETQDGGRCDATNDDEKSEAVNTGDGGEADTKIEDETETTTEIDVAAGEKTETAKDDNGNSDAVDKDSGGNQTEKEGNEDTEKNGDSGGLSSFHQHSSSKNAFTGLASTSFSASSFSFGLVPQQGSTVSVTEQSPFSFGLSNNGISSLFGASRSASIVTKSTETTTAFPSKQDVSVETGEENEKAAFTAGSVMFEYLEGGWKERGKGELKVSVSTTDNGNARLVMRSKGNYRLILNASLYPEMKLANMDKKGITFACVNSINEAEKGLSTFALKFKDPTVVEEFRAVIEKHKESKPSVVEAAAPLKTPENSPRAEDT